jgi:hypothetical protein
MVVHGESGIESANVRINPETRLQVVFPPTPGVSNKYEISKRTEPGLGVPLTRHPQTSRFARIARKRIEPESYPGDATSHRVHPFPRAPNKCEISKRSQRESGDPSHPSRHTHRPFS